MRAGRAAVAGARVIALCAVLLLLGVQQARFYGFFIDDSYISLVYVKNWLAGNGLTYNGLVVEGYSNFLWVVSLCAIGLFGVDPVVAAKWLGMACAGGTLAALVALGYTLMGRWREGLAGALLLALCGPFVAWSVGGLETCMFTLLLVLMARDLVREGRDPNRWPLSALWTVLLALTRPEGIGLVAVAWAWLAANSLFDRNQLTPTSERSTEHAPAQQGSRFSALGSRFFYTWTLLVALGFGLFLLWRYGRYGDLLPSTVYAKSGALRDQLYAARVRLVPLASAWWLLLASVLVGATSCLLLLRDARRAVALLLLLLGAYGGFVVLAGADWMPMHRFVVPLLPFAALLAACGFGALVQMLPARWKIAQPWLLVALLAPACLQVALWSESNRAEAITIGRSSFEPNIALAEQIRARATATTKIAVIDAGALAYYSEAPTLDLYGLNNHHIARLPGGFGTRFDGAYILSYAPEWIVTHYETTSSGVPRFVSFEPLYKLYYSSEFQRWYAPDSTLPLAPFHRLAQPREQTMMDRFYASSITVQPSTMPLRVGKPEVVGVVITNKGTGTWRSAPRLEAGSVYLRAQLINPATGQQVAEQWTPLPHDLRPGEQAEVAARITAPRDGGSHLLRLDLVLNGVARFADEGDRAVEVEVLVQ